MTKIAASFLHLRTGYFKRYVRRPRETFYLLAQNLVFCNSDLDKSTTAPPFVRSGIWNIHVHKVRVNEAHAYKVHACEAQYIPMRCTSIRHMPMICTPMRHMPMRCYYGEREDDSI